MENYFILDETAFALFIRASVGFPAKLRLSLFSIANAQHTSHDPCQCFYFYIKLSNTYHMFCSWNLQLKNSPLESLNICGCYFITELVALA